jgi:hypothetical protein
MAKTFPDQSLETVALGRGFGAAFGYDQSKSRVGLLIGPGQRREATVSDTAGAGEHIVKFARCLNSQGFRKPILAGTQDDWWFAALYSQTLAALGATVLDDLTAVCGGHTGTETVGTLALDYAGLKSSFHRLVHPNCDHMKSATLGRRPGLRKARKDSRTGPGLSIETGKK